MQDLLYFNRERWFANPRIKGAYSFFSTSAAQNGLSFGDLASPVWPLAKTATGKQGYGLMFAGEATHADYFDTVPGAVLSGYREADRLNALYTRHGPF